MRAKSQSLLWFILVLAVGLSAFLLVQYMSLRSDLQELQKTVAGDRADLIDFFSGGYLTSDLDAHISDLDWRTSEVESSLASLSDEFGSQEDFAFDLEGRVVNVSDRLATLERCIERGLSVYVDLNLDPDFPSGEGQTERCR